MIRSKLGLLGLCTLVFGLMAMSASSAQAALSWLIWNTLGENPKELKAPVIGETDNTDLTLLTKVLGVMLSATCTNFQFVGLNLEAGGTLTTGFKVKYTGCGLYEGAALGKLRCKISSLGQESGTIESNALKGSLALHTLTGGGTEVLAKIEPEAAGPLITILADEECALFESLPVYGVVYLKDCEGRALTNSIKHLIEQGPLTSLYTLSDTKEHLETSLIGSLKALLGGFDVGGHLWAAMDA